MIFVFLILALLGATDSQAGNVYLESDDAPIPPIEDVSDVYLGDEIRALYDARGITKDKYTTITLYRLANPSGGGTEKKLEAFSSVYTHQIDSLQVLKYGESFDFMGKTYRKVYIEEKHPIAFAGMHAYDETHLYIGFVEDDAYEEEDFSTSRKKIADVSQEQSTLLPVKPPASDVVAKDTSTDSPEAAKILQEAFDMNRKSQKTKPGVCEQKESVTALAEKLTKNGYVPCLASSQPWPQSLEAQLRAWYKNNLKNIDSTLRSAGIMDEQMFVDTQMVARTIISEAGSSAEPYEHKLFVSWVIHNRTLPESNYRPKTYSGIVTAREQFSGWSDVKHYDRIACPIQSRAVSKDQIALSLSAAMETVIPEYRRALVSRNPNLEPDPKATMYFSPRSLRRDRPQKNGWSGVQGALFDNQTAKVFQTPRKSRRASKKPRTFYYGFPRNWNWTRITPQAEPFSIDDRIIDPESFVLVYEKIR